MLMTTKIDVLVSPFLEGDELVVDVMIEDKEITPVRMPISALIDEYIQYNAELFSNSIAPANRDEAKQLVGILRLAAHTLEAAIT